MFFKNSIGLLLIHTIMCLRVPSRKFTSYYGIPSSDLCIPIHHTLNYFSEFIRLNIEYSLHFVNLPKNKLHTIYYLKRKDSSCNGAIKFSTLGNQITSGVISMSMGWDISQDAITTQFIYQFLNEIDSSVTEFVSDDGLFVIPVELSADGQEYLHLSPQVPVQDGIALLSSIVFNSWAICVKADNNKFIPLLPDYLDNEPTDQISYIKIITIRTGLVFSKKYQAYSCGSPNIFNYYYPYRFVLEDPKNNKVEFYAISKHYTFVSGEEYETEESESEFELNHGFYYEYVGRQTEFYNDEARFYLLETSERRKFCCSQRSQALSILSLGNKNLYVNTKGMVLVSPNVYRQYIEPQSSLPQTKCLN